MRHLFSLIVNSVTNYSVWHGSKNQYNLYPLQRTLSSNTPKILKPRRKRPTEESNFASVFILFKVGLFAIQTNLVNSLSNRIMSMRRSVIVFLQFFHKLSSEHTAGKGSTCIGAKISIKSCHDTGRKEVSSSSQSLQLFRTSVRNIV